MDNCSPPSIEITCLPDGTAGLMHYPDGVITRDCSMRRGYASQPLICGMCDYGIGKDLPNCDFRPGRTYTEELRRITKARVDAGMRVWRDNKILSGDEIQELLQTVPGPQNWAVRCNVMRTAIAALQEAKESLRHGCPPESFIQTFRRLQEAMDQARPYFHFKEAPTDHE